VSYIVRCALPAGHSITKKDQYGNNYTFNGALGLAPGWESGPTTQNDRYWISSCLMAHINTSGKHIPLYLDGPNPLGWGRSNAYPIQEGTFVGDLFTSPPVARYCGGRGFGSNVVAGRIGDDNQHGQPYSVMRSSSGDTSCDVVCTGNASGDGYTNCGGMAGNPITVWRQLAAPPAIGFEGNTGGFNAQSGDQPLALSVASDRFVEGSHSLLATINAKGSGVASIQTNAPASIHANQTLTVFLNVPTGTNWNYAQFFLQEPAKNYRWTRVGYTRSQITPGEWTSIVIGVPSDYNGSGAQLGVNLITTGPGTIKAYLDAVYSEN
jgi:hypothetical protein